MSTDHDTCFHNCLSIERPEGAYRPRGDRDDYRRRDDGEKKEGASGNFAPEFRSGLGRGRPAQQ